MASFGFICDLQYSCNHLDTGGHYLSELFHKQHTAYGEIRQKENKRKRVKPEPWQAIWRNLNTVQSVYPGFVRKCAAEPFSVWHSRNSCSCKERQGLCWLR